MKPLCDQYIIEEGECAQKLVSPLKATLDELKDFPPALIQVAENDIRRAQGEAKAAD